MDYEKQLYWKLKNLINNIDSEKAISEAKEILFLYENKDKRNLKPFLAVLSDFDVKTNICIKTNRIVKHSEENMLKKLIYANILHDRFRFTNKEITEVLNCSRAAVKYYLENNEIKKKYNAIKYNAILNQLNKVLEKYNL